MWPLFRPLLAVTSMLLMGLTVPLGFLEKSPLNLQLLGVTYHFEHEGNPAYVWTCYDQFESVLCAPPTTLGDTCSEAYSLKIAGLIFLALTGLVFLLQVVDLLQTLLIRSRIFSATTKVDVYGLSPVIYALAIVIYSFITGVYKGTYAIDWGFFMAFACEGVLVVFAVVAMILERAESPNEGQEPLLPVKNSEAQELQS